MFEKKSYIVQMNFDIPEEEKRIAQEAYQLFEDLISQLKLSVNHLNLIYDPFKKYENFDANEVFEHRLVLRRYRDKIKENFNNIMRLAYRCTMLMGEFSSDTKTVEMMNSFIAQMNDIEKQVNGLLSIFSDLNSDEFKTGLLNGIDLVKKEVSQVKQLINDRILEHIGTNILAENWVSGITDEYQNKIYEKIPKIIRLFEERKKAVDAL